MKQRKVLVGIAIAIFVILLLYWLLVAEDMKPCRNQAMNCCVREGTIADNQGFISSATNNQ